MRHHGIEKNVTHRVEFEQGWRGTPGSCGTPPLSHSVSGLLKKRGRKIDAQDPAWSLGIKWIYRYLCLTSKANETLQTSRQNTRAKSESSTTVVSLVLSVRRR